MFRWASRKNVNYTVVTLWISIKANPVYLYIKEMGIQIQIHLLLLQTRVPCLSLLGNNSCSMHVSLKIEFFWIFRGFVQLLWICHKFLLNYIPLCTDYSGIFHCWIFCFVFCFFCEDICKYVYFTNNNLLLSTNQNEIFGE